MNDDINQQILLELKRLRRSGNIGLSICVLLVVGVAIYLPLRHRSLSAPPQSGQTQTDSWAAVHAAMNRFDYDGASAIAQRIVEKHPNDYYGYAYLGNIALATGSTKEAQKYYIHAYELLPSEENEKMLGAIGKRIVSESFNQPINSP
jgi:cytochrome c-type biogenesis protein CcmH/NrfG